MMARKHQWEVTATSLDDGHRISFGKFYTKPEADIVALIINP